MSTHEPTASWVNPLVLEAERAHARADVLAVRVDRLADERDRLFCAVRWAEIRATDYLAFVGDHRGHGLSYALEVLEEIRAELDRALRAAQEDQP